MTETPKRPRGRPVERPMPEPPAAPPPVINPRYAGATPKMVGRALLRTPPADDETERPAVAAE